MARGPAVKIILTDGERSELEMRVRRRKIARAAAMRAEIVLLAADGMNNSAIADELGVSRLTTGLWRKWFAKRPRFHVHFTPTYGSWLNLVERWFAEITNKRIRRGVFRSVRELESAIRQYIDVHNEDPKPFIWARTADDILASIARFAQRTQTAAQPS